MIKSMTGFARRSLRTKVGIVTAELRTVNHKFLEMSYKLPNGLSVFDDKVKGLVKSKIRRGKVYLNLVHEPTGESTGNVCIDERLAKRYTNKLKKLKKQLKVDGPIKLSDIVSFPGVINYKVEAQDSSRLWPFVKQAIDKALDKLIKDREREGSFLFRDLTKRMKHIRKIVLAIKSNASSNVEKYKNRLKSRIKELSGGYAIDRGRLEVEVALFAKNSDITEELTRLDNHIQNFNRTIRKSGEVGKKLDFIAQELHREINTVGSKASGFNISKGVIEVKTEIEKIREQLKNIE